jgi:hypothetical protein
MERRNCEGMYSARFGLTNLVSWAGGKTAKVCAGLAMDVMSYVMKKGGARQRCQKLSEAVSKWSRQARSDV